MCAQMYERSLQDADDINTQLREQSRRVSLRRSINHTHLSDVTVEKLEDNIPPTLSQSEPHGVEDLSIDLKIDLDNEEGEDMLSRLSVDQYNEHAEPSRKEGPVSKPYEWHADGQEVRRLQEALNDALSQLDKACKENEKQSTIYSITRKEMFAAQEKVDELSFSICNLEEMNELLKENVSTMSGEIEHKDVRIHQMNQELEELTEKFNVQVKLNTSLTNQVEKLEQKGILITHTVCAYQTVL
jgi:chromosome segregation ATPase